MKKLSKENIKIKETLTSQLFTTADNLRFAVDVYNNSCLEAWNTLSPILEMYNNAVAAAKDWAAEMASDIESYMDDRSDAWREGDKAFEYETWKDAHAEVDLDELEAYQPQSLEFDADPAEAFSQLPESVEG